MALVQWNESYSVKVKRCDEDHKKLFAMINTLQQAMTAGKGAEKVQEVVKQLADYARFHFSTEEALMSKTNYPELAAHRAQHEAFVKKVAEFQKDLAAGKSDIESVPVSVFLNDWLINHIRRVDQKYSAHLNANGVS